MNDATPAAQGRDDAQRATDPSAAGRPRVAGVYDLTVGAVGPTLLRFAAPTLLSAGLQTTSGVINAVWVGRLLGEDALAATLNGNLVSHVLTTVIIGLSLSATLMIGRAIGRNDMIEARRVMGTAVGALLTSSLVIAICGALAAPALLVWLGAPTDAAPLALAYLRMTFLGLPSALLLSLCLMGLRGLGDARSPVVFTLVAAGIDLLLNPVLILGVGPLPAFGVAGSAMALTMAYTLVLLVVIGWIYARDIGLRLRGREWRFLRPDPARLLEMLRKGLPMGAQMITMTLSGFLVLSLVNRHGVATTAAYSVAQLIWAFLDVPIIAMQVSVSAVTAQAIGAGDWLRIRCIVRAGVGLSVAFSTLVVGAVLLNVDRLAIVFVEGSQASLTASHILALTSWTFVFSAVSAVLTGSLRADGVVLRPLVIGLTANGVVRLAVAYGGTAVLGVDALWLSVSASQSVTFLGMCLLYRYEHRRHRLPLETRQAAQRIAERRATATALPVSV